jgi:high affinity Mn2+ porin
MSSRAGAPAPHIAMRSKTAATVAMFIRKILLAAFILCCLLGTMPGQDAPSDSKSDDTPVTIFPHPDGRYWISGQMNFIFQGHVGFPAAYSGRNSLRSSREDTLSRVYTLFTGVQIFRTTEVLFDLESAGGGGISDALGLAGFTNVDVVRNPELGSKPYVARVMLHRTIALSHESSEQGRNPFALSSTVPKERLEIRVGKFSAADFFDTNAVGGDSHLQFTNWTTVNNGAYDYAADTRGYTYGAIVEYQQPRFGIRFGEMLMPKVANGIKLDWDLGRAHSENIEFEFRHPSSTSTATTIKALVYQNTANMGDYREAIAAFTRGSDLKPDITAHRHQGSRKYGFGFNIEQDFAAHFRTFARLGWNEGRHESFAYTEVNSTASFGFDVSGECWHRVHDKIGSAFVSNGISSKHAEYLRLGGLGFLLGDGNLRYGRENIWETYYTMHIWRGIFTSGQLQFIVNPGYNQDRGPAWVPGLRLHVDF